MNTDPSGNSDPFSTNCDPCSMNSDPCSDDLGEGTRLVRG